MNITGEYGEAIVYNDHIDELAEQQIKNVLNHPMADKAHIRVMPDCHGGAGCVIGYTAKLTDYVVPNLIGVDIGCSVSATSMNKVDLEHFNKRFARLIPVGRNVHEKPVYECSSIAVENMENFESVCDFIGMDKDYMKRSLGTLGGGNHYGEVDVDSGGNWWFTIHTGSRNFGLKVAQYFQKLAQKQDYSKQIAEIRKNYEGKEIEEHIKAIEKKPNGLEWLEPIDRQNYLLCMHTAQEYAKANHDVIIHRVLTDEYKRFVEINYQTKVVRQYFVSHNYIDTYENIVRKGAVSAQRGEKILIPLNMRDGVLFCEGKGNLDWNFSAPHGAGRLMSRTQAKAKFTLEAFEDSMQGIYSTCVSESTLDESPMAYKNADDIKKYIEPTATIIDHWKPVWNYKG